MHPEYVQGWRDGIADAKENVFAMQIIVDGNANDMYWQGYRDGHVTYRENAK